MKIKFEAHDINDPVVCSHLGGEGWCPMSTRELQRQENDDGHLHFEAEVHDSTLRHLSGVIGDTGYCGVLITDLDSNRIIHRHRMGASSAIKYGNEDSYVSLTPPEPVRDYSSDSIDYETVDDEAKMKFLEAFNSKLNTISKALSIKPKRGDLAIIYRPADFGSDHSIFMDESLSYAEKKLAFNKLSGRSSGWCSKETTGFVHEVRVRNGRTQVYVDDWSFMFKVLDPETLEEKSVDTEAVGILVLELKEFCNKNNYHIQDETLSQMEAQYVCES